MKRFGLQFLPAIGEGPALAPITMTFFASSGFNAAIVGVVSRCGTEPLALYDRAKCIQILMDEGCSHSDAEDYFCFNVEGCWAGPHTPMIASFNLDPVGTRYPVSDLECVTDIGADAEIVFGSHITGTHDLSSTGAIFFDGNVEFYVRLFCY